MPRYKLTLEYDGTNLAGWQRQKDAPSAQQHLEEAIHRFCQEHVTAACAGRTDAGVHARGQVVHLDLTAERSLFSIRNGLNYYLENKPVVVLDIENVAADFNARFDAKKRHYRYIIANRPSPLVLDAGRAWYVRAPLSLHPMQYAAQYLTGHHDFTSFRAAGCQAKSPMKTLDAITVRQEGEYFIFDLSSKSFLYHMVRNIVGTLAEVGMGHRKPGDVWKILEAKNRTLAGQTAAACGLYFMRVEY